MTNKYSIRLSLLCLTLWVSACNLMENQLKDDQPRRMEILFLGHESQHHNSRLYAPHLIAAIAKKGINITYKESTEVLNSAYLNQFDGLILYANHDSIGVNEEKALLEYVEDGHAFIPIHCASYCFRNSDEFVAMTGGQFASHDTATFSATIVDPNHPAMAGLEEFTSWDETYVHHQLADDITVLMEREENGEKEPWTWVKSYGKGKVFYTASGHDERTWSEPGFHELILNGLVWAVSDQVRQNWEAFAADIPELQYEPRPNIPNYEKRDPAPQYQMPLSPEESAKHIQVPPGFKFELFASEPDIINPISMNWDERGRLWVVETVDYPNTVRNDEGVGDDRIKICEDTDGDGRADKFTVFAENLNIPTSFTFVNGGILISQAPQFIFLQDTDGDDVADVKEVIIDGWGVFDTHAGPSNLQYGIDNQVYGVLGYSGFKGLIFGDSFEFRQGIYRFDKDYTSFEFLTNTTNNTWGLGITEDNAIFASTANNTHSVFMGVPNQYLRGLEGGRFRGSEKIDGHYAMLPLTPNVRQVDVFGGYTAAAGHNFYTARLLPTDYWNQVAFVCEPTGGLVHQAIIESKGSGYQEKDGGNIFAASDEWVSPVEAKTGPDGAVWVLDWYNFIVQHNPTPTAEWGGFDAENGDGNAYVNPLRDKSHGRIWRVVPKNAKVSKAPELRVDDPEGLVAALKNDNLFWRLTAQRLLVESKATVVTDALVSLVKDKSTDERGLAPSALHALWTLDGLGLIENGHGDAIGAARSALFHPAPSVRRAAIQILNDLEGADELIFNSGALDDEDPTVQLAALLFFAGHQTEIELGDQLYRLLQMPDIQEDKWRGYAIYSAATHHINGFIDAFMADHPNYDVQGEIQEDQPLDERFTLAYFSKRTVKDLTTTMDLGPATKIVIGTVENEMKYDVTAFEVEAGKPVELVFENTDFMQHNLLILKPGTKEKVGAATDKMAAASDAAERNYTPDMEEILYAIQLLNPEEQYTLKFIAPEEPGIYPYICTFPGHWRLMQGNMKVVPAKKAL